MDVGLEVSNYVKFLRAFIYIFLLVFVGVLLLEGKIIFSA